MWIQLHPVKLPYEADTTKWSDTPQRKTVSEKIQNCEQIAIEWKKERRPKDKGQDQGTRTEARAQARDRTGTRDKETTDNKTYTQTNLIKPAAKCYETPTPNQTTTINEQMLRKTQ